jgi:magnesium transporter
MDDTINASTNVDPAAPDAALAQEYAADIVERLNAEPLERASAVLSGMPLKRAVEVLDQPGLEAAADLVEAQPPDRAVSLLTAMSADRRADIFRHLEAATRDRLLARLDAEKRASLVQLLAYPKNTAGSIMTTEFVSVPASWTVDEALRYIRMVESTSETIYAIYVLDPTTNKLVKTVSLRRLITGEPQASVLSVAPSRRPLTVSPLTDRHYFRHYRRSCRPPHPREDFADTLKVFDLALDLVEINVGVDELENESASSYLKSEVRPSNRQ